MIYLRGIGRVKQWRQGLWISLGALALGACATTHGGMSSAPRDEVDASGQPIIQAGDVAIAGQLASHSIMNLSEVADATTPPLVRFSGVTSIVNGPVDTQPYTSLLRDRLLLLTREKLRFVERQLPAFKPHKVRHSSDVGGPLDVASDADYQIMAQLRGNFSDDTYLLDVEFIDLHTNQPLFNGDYRIHKEEQAAPEAPMEGNPAPESTAPNPAPIPANPGPVPGDVPDETPPPPPYQPMPEGNSGLQ